MRWADLPPGTRNILILFGIILIANLFVTGPYGALFQWLAIAPEPSFSWLWQWATYWMITGTSGKSVIWKIIELILIAIMGAEYENRTGTRALWGLFAFSIFGEALGAMLGLLLTPRDGWAGSSFTVALIVALSVRARGQKVMVPGVGPADPWVVIGFFGLLAAFDAISNGFIPILTAFLGSAAAGYIWEKWKKRIFRSFFRENMWF
ncbi:MAG: hypothetical protein N2515_07725 [Deltaproteobacteria bacterium]|nr:hypothetical protein [Deltaproteobacteria bacterium]